MERLRPAKLHQAHNLNYTTLFFFRPLSTHSYAYKTEQTKNRLPQRPQMHFHDTHCPRLGNTHILYSPKGFFSSLFGLNEHLSVQKQNRKVPMPLYRSDWVYAALFILSLPLPNCTI